MDEREELNNVMIYRDNDTRDKEIRVYDTGTVLQSATYTDEDSRYELVFEYMKQFNRAFEVNPEAGNVMLFGGAGYAYPKYVISHYPEVSIDVVEIDPQAYQTACQFFYFDQLIKDYGLDNNHRFRNIIRDARDYIYRADRKYDIIIDDAFVDVEPVYSLLTIESFRQIKSLLTEKGQLVINLSGFRKIDQTYYLLDVLKTLQEIFANVIVLKAFFYKYTRTGNYVIIASDKPIPLENTVKYNTDTAGIITAANIGTLQRKFDMFLNK